ncbi:hypothetical protein SAMN04489806_3060 [Paramicrobacterium humi]|uniref:PIN domain-containing protein n=1 Tax=Paramicrobacterium humi TaxID=640635 RepID=A0A1H4INY8_9MICO|nr:hypothetical protein [Microbacterium humi]SEB34932.1 hypothetical protein SAMN04489806_0009 [Microbacterium humi]SEB34981.1 hypothetical protein SAMN04489806_0018 [Microbacterium humi]SEC49661.1 hypothetical protein SAMN04489806_3060 [Microbacterium humi]
MSRIVIDAPTLFHIVVHQLTPSANHQVVGAQGVRSQALQLLLLALRAGQVDESDVKDMQERITRFTMRLLGDRVSRDVAWDIAAEQSWDSVLDAELVALTRLQADALCTVDDGLRAKVEGLVPLVPLAAILN